LIERQPDLKVCGVATNGREAVDLALKTKPDVVVLDLTMPGMDGLDAIRRIRTGLSETEVLVFSGHSAKDLVEDVFEAGAKSYIEKSDASQDLITAIKSLAEHKPFFTAEASETLFAKFLQPARKQRSRAELKLTTREREIVRLLAQSSTNKEVAAALGIRVRTVETHRATLMRKLGAKSVAGLVQYAIRNHLIEL
jgi:DNA-binding NarL/FixJ family response regulator